MRKLLLVFTLFPCLVWGQSVGDYRSDQTGNWTAATTWQVFVSGAFQNLESGAAGIYQNVIPQTSASPATGLITVLNNVTVNTAITADQVTVSALTLTISGAGVLTIADAVGDDLTLSSTGAISVTTGVLVISAVAVYNHARNGGIIPLATWQANSTCRVSGILGTSPTLNALSSYQNFTWNCPGQSGIISLASNLRDVNLNLNIENTNNQLLRFATGTVYTLNIDGNFNVTGNSAFAFGTTAAGVVVNLLGSFDFASTSATASLLKSSGSYTFNISNNFSVSSGLLTLSTGAGAGTINIAGNFLQMPSTLTETGAGASFVLNGVSSQGINSTGTISNTVNFQVNNASGVILNTALAIPGSLTQTVGNIDLNNNTLRLNGNFTQTTGAIIISPSAEFIVQGTGTLPASINFSGTDLLRLEMNRAATTLTTASNMTVTTLNLLNGTLTHTGTLTIAGGGTIQRSAGSITNAPVVATSYNVLYSNAGAINTGLELPTSATALNNLTKQGAGTATLSQALVTINGNFTTTTGTFAMGANSISLAGNYVSNAALTTAVGATFTFTSATATLTGSTAPSFRNLVVNGTLTPSVGYNVSANYTVGPGASVSAGSGTVTFNGSTIITNNGTLNLNTVTFGAVGNSMTAPVTTMGIAGNFTSNGVFNNGGGTILFNGTTNLSATQTYNNITISGAVSAVNIDQTVAGSMINNGTFSISNTNAAPTTGNLTWSGSGTLSGSGTTTVADVNVSGTSFTYTATGNLTLNDDVLGAGTFDSSSPTAGTVIFAGSASAITAGGGTRTFRNLSVTGSLTPAMTYTLAGTGGLSVSGTLVSGSTVIFGGAIQTITGAGTIAFNTFTTNLGSTLTITPNITINANLAGAGSITSNGTITFVGLTMSGAGAKNFTNVTVGTGTLTPNANYSISGNLVVSGTLAAGTGTTTFGSTTAVSGAGGINFNFLTITGSLTASTGTMTVVRDFTNNGTFIHNGGTIAFSTVGTNQIQILGSNSITFNNLTVNDVAVATDVLNGINAGQSISLAGVLTFSENNSIIDADGAAGDRTFTVLSNTDTNAAINGIIGASGTGSNIAGNFTVQRFVSSEARIYRYISSPVIGATVAQLKAVIPVTGTFTDPSDGASSPPCTGCLTTSPSLYRFNATSAAYEAFPAAGLASASTFENGRGYSTFFRHTGLGAVGAIALTFTGTNASGSVPVTVSPAALGYSLVGNPYPSPLRWDNGAGWTKTNIADNIVVRDNATGLHQTYSAVAGTGIIAPGQSFWVQSSNTGAALTINQAAKTVTLGIFYKTGAPMLDELEMRLTKVSTGTTDNAKITIVNGSSSSYDPFDALKFDNSIDDGSTVTQVHDISIFSSGSRLAVNAVPTVCSQTFTVNMRDVLNSGETSMNYDFTINASGALKSSGWILRDNKTNADIDLTVNPVYNFSVDIGETTQVLIPLSNPVAYRYHLPSRFLLIKSSAPTINVSGSVTTSPSICEGSESILTVSSQNGFTYGVEVNGSAFYPNVAQGNGSDISIFVESGWLDAPTNTIRIKASSGCDSQFLTASSQVTKEGLYTAVPVSAQSCYSGSVTLSASGAPSASNYNWYASETSSTILATGSQFNTPVLSDTVSYYVAAFNSLGCEGTRAVAMANVSDVTAQISVIANAPIVCRNSSMTFSASSDVGGTFNWYETLTSTTVLSVNSKFTTPALAKTTKYYVSFKNNAGCEGSRVEVSASISNFSPVLGAENGLGGKQICPNGFYTLTASGAPANSTYAWFESQDSEIPVMEGNSFITPALEATRKYYLAAKNELGCYTERYAIEAIVDSSKPLPSFTSSADAVCKNGSSRVKVISLDPSNVTYKWYESANAEPNLREGFELQTDQIDSDKAYYVAAINANGCEGDARKEIVVKVTKFADPVIDSNLGILTSNFSSGNQWYYDEELIVGENKQTLETTQPGLYNLKITYNGCSEWASPIMRTDLVTGFEDSEQTVEIYPNPASEIVSIRFEGTEDVKASLIDGRGAVLEAIPLRQEGNVKAGELDVRSFSKGLYFLRIYSDSKSITHKVIIK